MDNLYTIGITQPIRCDRVHVVHPTIGYTVVYTYT